MRDLESVNPSQIILLTVDALRADTAQKIDTLSELASAHIDIPDCQSTGSGTPTAMPGIMQSRLPTDHGGKAQAHPLVKDVPTLAETLSRNGCLCAGWHSNVYTSRDFDYHRGFDVFADLKSDPPDRPVAENNNDHGTNQGGNGSIIDAAHRLSQRLGVERLGQQAFYLLARYGLVDHRPYSRAETVVDAMLSWLSETESTQPRFAWGHLMDLHSPYLPPISYCEQVESCPTNRRERWRVNEQLRLAPQDIDQEQAGDLRGLYEAGAHYIDDQIERLVETLKQRKEWEETVLIVTADHGELFGDCSLPDDYPWEHANFLYDYITHVPLVIAGGTVPKDTIGGVASGFDIAPTVARLLDIEVSNDWVGSPISSESYYDRDSVYSVTGRGSKQDMTESELIPPETLHVSLRSSEKAVLWWSGEHYGPETFERTDTHTDPTVHETPLEGAIESTERIKQIEKEFEQVAHRIAGDGTTESKELDEETTERLRQLGYVE
jgi:arylsulfatase A-like enzyme